MTIGAGGITTITTTIITIPIITAGGGPGMFLYRPTIPGAAGGLPGNPALPPLPQPDGGNAAVGGGGVLGGVIANEIGYGNPAAVIGGSVLGSVLGHEIAH